MLRKVVMGSSLVALVPAVRAATPVGDSSKDVQKLIQPSDLPLYDDHRLFKSEPKPSPKPGFVQSALLKPVSQVRKQVQGLWEQTASVKLSVQDTYNEFTDRTDWIVKYLQEEENKQMRRGAVVMGGLTGFIFGLRGGIIRRVFYAGVGTVVMGAVCFPEDTNELAHQNGILARKYINIVYNFLYGVKPGDPQLEVKFPELSFPKDLSEFVDLTISVASSLKQAVMPPPKDLPKDTKPEKKD